MFQVFLNPLKLTYLLDEGFYFLAHVIKKVKVKPNLWTHDRRDLYVYHF